MWGFSAFVFEDAIRKINLFHHGSNKVNVQTMKHYLLHQTVKAEGNIEHADDKRKEFYSYLTGSVSKEVKL